MMVSYVLASSGHDFLDFAIYSLFMLVLMATICVASYGIFIIIFSLYIFHLFVSTHLNLIFDIRWRHVNMATLRWRAKTRYHNVAEYSKCGARK